MTITLPKVDVSHFCRMTNLQLRMNYKNEYYEISGKSYNYINKQVQKYNKMNGTHIIASNDYTKDLTIIHL